MNTFVRKGVTYACAMRPPCGVWPNRYEGVILRKTDERVNVHDAPLCRQYERIVWVDENDDWYVRWEGRFVRIDRHYGSDVWHPVRMYTPLIDA